MSYIGRSPQIGAYHKLDSITCDGSTAYTMLLDSANFVAESVNHLIVSVNGVIQAPTDSFTVSGSTITFASALSSSDTIDFIMALGNVLDIGTPSDSTVSSSKIIDGAISSSKLATTSITGQTAETSANDSDSLLIYDDSATALRKMTRANFLTGVGGNNTPAFLAYHNTTQNVSDGTTTTLNFNTEDFDSDGKFDTSNGRFTPGEAGKYFLFARIKPDDQNSYWGELTIKTSDDNSISLTRSNNFYVPSFTVTGVANLTSSEYAFVTFYHTQGGTRTIVAGTAFTHFGGFKLIGA